MQSPLVSETPFDRLGQADNRSYDWAIAELYLKLGRLNQSLQLAYTLAQRDPNQHQRYLNHQATVTKLGAEFAEEIGDFSRAAYYWTQLTQSSPHNADAWYGLGIAKANLQDYTGAEIAMQQSLRLSPGNPQVQKQLLGLQALMGG